MTTTYFKTTQTLGTHVPLSLKARVYELASERGISASRLTRELIEEGLKNLDKPKSAAASSR